MEEEPVRKPRQLRGTPAYKYTFKLAFYFVGGCFALHMVSMYFYQNRLYRKTASGYYDASKFMKDRRKMMSNFIPIADEPNRPVREWDNHANVIKYNAESTLDVDLR